MSNPSKFSTDKDAKVEKWTLPTMLGDESGVFHNETERAANKHNNPEDGHEAVENPIPTAEEIEQWHEQARQEGYQEGLKQAQLEMAVHGEQLQQLIEHFAHPLQSLNDEIEQQLKLLTVTLAQQLVRREIRQEPGEIIALIRESLPLLPAASRRIRVYLHPEDAELVRNALQLDEIEDQENWKLVEDPMISRGGCEIKSEKSVINATLENRLQALAASVLGGERLNDQPEREDPSKASKASNADLGKSDE